MSTTKRKLDVPVLLKDRVAEGAKGFEPLERREVTVESLLPGPISERVAIVDIRDDATLGEPLPVPRSNKDLVDQHPEPYLDPAIVRWSVFGTVHQVLHLYEAETCLGRDIPWAFGRPQLLVVPEAGRAANACYHRESGSLQFYSFIDSSGRLAHTAASHDIVAHETGHAVLDGIAPWLYDAQSPQSLAIHESVADLTALFAAASSHELVDRAIQLTGGDLNDTWLFSSIAQELGRSVGQHDGLRSLVDSDPERPLSLAFLPAGTSPHALSVVLSRAIYALLLDVYQQRSGRTTRATGPLSFLAADISEETDSDVPISPTDSSYRALHFAVQVVKRMLFRGLDYLPPADPSFLDLVRAVLACDRAAHPTDRNGLRAGLIRHALRRGIGVGESDLDTPADAIAAALGEIDIDSVLNSDWHAMRLIEQHRQRFAIPDGAPFDVLPRAMVRKKIMRSRGGPSWRSELLLKFHWRQTEPACGVDHLPQQRWVRSGCTVAIDAESRRVCAYLSIDPTPQTAARDAMVKALAESGALASLPGRSARPRDPIAWSVSAGAYELHATARALHLAPGSHR